MTLQQEINKIQQSGMKVVIVKGSKSYQPHELNIEQLSSDKYEVRLKPVNRKDGIYKIIYYLGE